NIQTTINNLLDSIADNWERGSYKQAYLDSRNALGLVGFVAVEREIACRVFISSAKSAYYMSRFNESENNLVKLESLLNEPCVVEKDDFRQEISIIRADILRRKGDYSKAIVYIDSLPDISDGSVHPRFVISRHMIRGACLMRLGFVDEARNQLETALGLATHVSDEKARSSVLATLGLLSMRMGFLKNAGDYFKRAIKIYRSKEDIYGQSVSLLNRGIVQYHLGRFDDAESDIKEAISGFTECEWKIGICRALLALGNNERYRENFDSALKLYKESRAIADSNGYQREKALVLGGLGRIYLEAENYTKAESCFRKALRIAYKAFPKGDVALEQHISLGELYLSIGDYEESSDSFKKALKLARLLKARMEEGLIFRGMGLSFFGSGNRKKAENYFEKSIEILRITGDYFALAQTQLKYSEILFEYFDGVADERMGIGGKERERVERLWRLLIEVEHLSCGIQTNLFKEKTDALLDGVVKIRSKLTVRRNEIREGNTLVELQFDPQFIVHDELVSISKSMLDVYDSARFAASFSAPVLITGETGTGKELIARLIHNLSDRSQKKFVAVNCSAVPDRLFESEFFGHTKGCFTGAISDRRGLFEEASGGSIFLDEIGELTDIQQAKLLRVLQEKKIRRVGDNVEREIDVRFISATNKILGDDIGDSSMREDFYYRISEERVSLAPIRDRKEDIIPLLTFCLSRDGDRKNRKIRIEREALKCIQRYPWPGNVREFFAVIKRVGHISGNGIITVDMLPDRVKGSESLQRSFVQNINADGRNLEKKTSLMKLLKRCNGNKTAVARWLGISRSTLYKELKRVGLNDMIR
ncbi:sigma 54-interacting transcriptional regulator, partial [bacterium]|nr:sigma 54-interacting transcriptional regulator [bacterium]